MAKEVRKEEVLTRIEDFPSEPSVKQKLNRSLFNGEDLKLYLLFRFGTYEKAASIVGFTDARIHQICSGYSVPEGPDLIKKIAECWEIDIVVLSALFERLRNLKGGVAT